MANKRFYQFAGSKIPNLRMIQGLIPIGSTGAVGTISGGGVQAVTRLAAGIYKIKLVDNYVALLDADFNVFGGVTGSAVNAGSFVTGTLYQIITMGTTTQAQWVTAGFDADYTAAVGSVFVAAAGGAGNGTVKAIGASGIVCCELGQGVQSLMVNLNPSLGRGSSIIVQTMGATDASTTTLIPKDPANGSQLEFKIWLRDSSVAPL